MQVNALFCFERKIMVFASNNITDAIGWLSYDVPKIRAASIIFCHGKTSRLGKKILRIMLCFGAIM